MDREKTIQHLKNIGAFDTNYSIESIDSIVNGTQLKFKQRDLELKGYKQFTHLKTSPRDNLTHKRIQ